MRMLPTLGVLLLAISGTLRAQLVNGSFESGTIGGVPDGWSYVGPLERNAGNPGEHGSLGLRAAPNTLGGGNGVSTTAEGTRWLNGGRDSVYYQQVTASMVPGNVYRFSAYATIAGSSGPTTRISFTAAPLTVGTFATEPRLAQTVGIRGDQDSPPEWVLNVVTYAAQPADAGLPLYANLESYRDVSTAVIGWDAASVVSVRIDPVVVDAGGTRTSNAGLVHDGSLGGIGGISTQSVTTAKHSYIGQLYDFEALQLAASPLTVNEDGTRQIFATFVMDDATTHAATGGFAWSVTAGPMTIDSNGLASGQSVYQNTLATAQALAGSATGTLDLTVLNNLPDNFGSYAADGIDDDWQNQYFGLNNPNAGPLIDPDFDGQNNLFEFTAGIVPIDPQSRFLMNAEQVPGQPAQKNIIFSPRFSDRSYLIEFSNTLQSDSWLPLAGTGFSDNGTERTVTDLNATGMRKFYRVQITRP